MKDKEITENSIDRTMRAVSTGAKKREFTLHPGENNISFETNGWAKGVYVVNLMVEGKVVGSEKLIV